MRVFLCAWAAAMALCGAALADESDPRILDGATIPPTALALGSELFLQHCASCHGVEARGDGPIAGLLTVAVPDLTGLSARNDGVFPMLDVVHTIDGRTGRRAHGGPMPVWGQLFNEAPGLEMGPYGTPLEVRGRIMALALYLESIQP